MGKREGALRITARTHRSKVQALRDKAVMEKETHLKQKDQRLIYVFNCKDSTDNNIKRRKKKTNACCEKEEERKKKKEEERKKTMRQF